MFIPRGIVEGTAAAEPNAVIGFAGGSILLSGEKGLNVDL